LSSEGQKRSEYFGWTEKGLLVIVRDIRGKVGKIAAKFIGRKRAHFPPGKRVVSFSFDDFPSSAIANGARLLDERGRLGTFYAALGLAEKNDIPSRSEMISVGQRGHEIGCHTFGHLDCVDTPPSQIRLDCLENRRLALELGGVSLRSFSYPFGELNPGSKRVVGEMYDSARTVEEGINSGIIDLAALHGVSLFERGGIEAKKAWVKRLETSSGWLIFYTHDVCDPALEWGCSIDMFSTVLDMCLEAGIEVMTVGEVVDMCTLLSSH
jgi:peptidoglycan/xylan/chitin deacetylase (PgdA/CDA1 family)